MGVIGLGRRGMHWLERWIASDVIQVVMACDRDAAALELAEGLCTERTHNAEVLLGDARIDVVLIALPAAERAEAARRALAASKHVSVEPLIGLDAAAIDAVYDAAESTGRSILLWPGRGEDPDFRLALATLRSGLIGRARLLRFERWEPMVLDAPDERTTLSRPAIEVLEQVAMLAGEAARAVFATRLGSDGALITVVFASGLRAQIVLSASSSVRIEQGWAIEAEAGGYAAGRRWVRTEEGELYDVPAESSAETSFEERLIAMVTGNGSSATRGESLRLGALVSAVVRSVASGQAEFIE